MTAWPRIKHGIPLPRLKHMYRENIQCSGLGLLVYRAVLETV